MTAQTYASITKAVDQLVADHAENDPTVVEYMISRAALLRVRERRGADKAAQLAYRLADEFAGEGV